MRGACLQWPAGPIVDRTVRRRLQLCLMFLCLVVIQTVAGIRPAASQIGTLPPGQIVFGPVVRGQSFFRLGLQGTAVPEIINGYEANNFLDGLITPSTLSFVNTTGSQAAVVLTAVPTQFVRFYAPNAGIGQIGNFIVGTNAVRGLTPEQIRDLLALPAVPTMQTLVQVPAGTCLLFGTAGAILNSQAPPLGVWGHGGAVQEYIIGQQQNGAGCSSTAQPPLFISTADYINAQLIGAQALLYTPRAGGGNAGAVAGALDRGPYPALFTAMDSMYNALDVLNFGDDPRPLRSALVQLDGEVHASARTVMFGDSVYLREAVLGRMRQASFAGELGPMAALGLGGPMLAHADGAGSYSLSQERDSALAYADRSRPPFPVKAAVPQPPNPENVFWAQGVGAWGRFGGKGDASSVNRDLGGFFAGVDRRFAPDWLAGFAVGYTSSSPSIADPRSSAGIDTAHVAGYVGGHFGPWNLRGAASGSFNTVDTNRIVIFPGFFDADGARYHATTTQVFGEVGYGTSFGQIATEPFAGLAWVHLDTDSFAEQGGAAALSGFGSREDVGYSTLGARAADNYVLQSGLVLTPHVSVAWQHAFGSVNPGAALAFATNGASFLAAGVPLARDAALVNAGLDLTVTPQVVLQLVYFGQLADRVQDNSVKGTLKWRF
ncbi:MULTISPECIES: autotransporter domain-containing protein [unclassified Bradyrhizobium]|uniref:autotransporter outer membrane beta-barrel domain-containing protein n=3 Tax=unclassified Bradyrhizobium TaxID=2631580 RepID=UPI0028EA4004|nr:MULTISPECIES: autotransporter domain-containing protein [unclassified Bradyrhizobium]